LILTAAFLVLRQVLVREQQFSGVSHAVVFQSGSRGLTQLGLGGASIGWLGLLAGDLVGRLSAVLRAVFSLRSLRTGIDSFDWHFVGTTFRKYREYATISFPSALLDTAGTSLPLPLIIHYFGAAAGGQFALVQLVFALPLTLLGSGIGDVFYSRVAIRARSDKPGVRSFFLQTTGILFLLGIIPFSLIALLGPTLLSWVFGKQWHTAGVLAAVMTPWALSQLVVSPVSRIVFVVRGQRLKLYYDAASLVLVVVTLSITNAFGLPLASSVAWLSAAQFLSYLLYYLLILKAIQVFALTDGA
jgi:lipopolysaccharide exporter